MEPISLVSGIVLKGAEKGVALITKLREDAKNLRIDDARYYGAWFNIASEAIHWLEQEYIEIIIQAALCQLNEPQQKKDLLERINNYVLGEKLRQNCKPRSFTYVTGKTPLSSMPTSG